MSQCPPDRREALAAVERKWAEILRRRPDLDPYRAEMPEEQARLVRYVPPTRDERRAA